MQFVSLDAVLFTAGFLIPGFIWSAVLSMIVPRRMAGDQVRFLEAFVLSCINNGLWSWALFIIFKSGFLDHHPYWSALMLGGIIFLSPIGLGLLSGYFRQRQTVSRLLGRLGFRTVHPTPTAWDWHFSRERPSWVVVTLKDGSRIHGLFGYQSFAGDDPQHRDLYLEETYRLLETGDWAPVEDSAGVLIMPDEIAAIEFRKYYEVSNE